MPDDNNDSAMVDALLAQQTPRPDMLPNDQPQPVDPSLLGGGNRQALSDVAQAPSAQPQSTIPQSVFGSNKMPGLVRLIAAAIDPQTQQTQGQIRPPSRAADLEQWLGNFATALSAGLQTKPGPGANARAAGAAIMGPTQFQNQQALTEAEIQQRQAQAQLQQSQAQMGTLNVPGLGTVTGNQSVLASLGKGAGAAAITGQAGIEKAQITAQNKLDVAGMQAAIAQGTVSKMLPDVGQDGRPFYHVLNKYGKEIGQADVNIIPQLAQRVSNTTDFKEDSSGNIIALPKTTITSKLPPALVNKVPALGNVTPPPPSGFPQPGSTVASVTAPAPQSAPGPRVFAGPRVVAEGKAAADHGIAFDANSNQLIETTRSEAAQKGLQYFEKAGAGDFTKWRTAQTQFNDVQSNLSRYKAAAQRFAAEGKPSDGPLMDAIINKSGIFDLQLKIGEGGNVSVPFVNALTEAASRESRSAAYANLSPAGKDLVDGYFRTMAALPAYQRAITQSGKSSDHQLDLEIPQIANPTYPPADIMRKLNAFQENVRQGVRVSRGSRVCLRLTM